MRAHLRYASYLARHKWFVFIAGLATGAPLWRLLVHDWSKCLPSEWGPYTAFFYGPHTQRAELRAAFDRAWLRHQHRNPHHWQHWVLRKDDGGTHTLEMPEHFAREMVADWMGAGRAITGAWEVEDWYARNRERIVLHRRTRALVDSIIYGAEGAPSSMKPAKARASEELVNG